MTEAAKLRFLLNKLNHPQLKSDVSDLQAKNNLASGEDKVTFTKAAKKWRHPFQAYRTIHLSLG